MLAEASFASEPDAALEQALSIEDASIRDLTLLAGARASGRNLCDRIVSTRLMEACFTVVNRPHLYREGATPRSASAAPGGEIPEACRRLEGRVRDECVAEAAGQAGSLAAAAALCESAGDVDARGDCLARAAVGALRSGGELEASRVACEGIPDARWQGECAFRLAEELMVPERGPAVEPVLALCRQSRSFASECATHAVAWAAETRTRPLGAGTLRETAGAIEQGAAAFRDALGPDAALGEPTPLYRANAWYALLARASAQGRLAGWGGMAAALEEPAQRQLFQDLLDLSGLRAALLAEPRAERPPTLDASWQAWAEAQRLASPFHPGSAPLLDLGDELPAHPVGNLEELSDLQLAVGQRFALGAVPQALEYGSPCPPGVEGRRAVLALWALRPFPWPLWPSAAEQAAGHADPLVRLYLLDVLAEKEGAHADRHVVRPAWLRGLVDGLRSDPHPTIARRASGLASALDTGARLHADDAAYRSLCAALAGASRAP